ncbi:MAG: hypothetical protein FWE44_06475 [Defluviitaleaceae bacterium]|nr:hypothetical protein [Defluviitaleaceae bacterium]
MVKNNFGLSKVGAFLVIGILAFIIVAVPLWANSNREFPFDDTYVLAVAQHDLINAFESNNFVSIYEEEEFIHAFVRKNTEVVINKWIAPQLQDPSFTNLADPWINWHGGGWCHRIISAEEILELELELNATFNDLDDDHEVWGMIPDTFIFAVQSSVDPSVYHMVTFSFRIYMR